LKANFASYKLRNQGGRCYFGNVAEHYRYFPSVIFMNKWQYRDEYIIVIVVLREKIGKNTIKNCKKWHEWYSNQRSPGTMPGSLTTEPGMTNTASTAFYRHVDRLITASTVA